MVRLFNPGRWIAGLCLLASGLPAFAAEGPSLKERVEAITKGYDRSMREGASGARKTPSQIITEVIELAEKNPKDPITQEGLLWLSERFSRSIEGTEKATALLTEHFPVAREYADLVDAHNKAQHVYFEELRKPKTSDEQMAAWKKTEEVGPAFVEFAKKHPGHTAALHALVYALQRFRELQSDELVEILGRDYIAHEKLGEVCPNLIYSKAQTTEAFFRKLLDKSPHRNVRGMAAISLGRLLLTRVQLRTHVGDAPAEQLKALEDYYGKETLGKIRGMDPKTVEAEAIQLFERVVTEFADVEDWSGAIGDQAKSELFELRELSVGKMAPEISGKDIDGDSFKLSDYRGKVVVLDFWGDW